MIQIAKYTKPARLVLAILYAVGIVGFSLPQTAPIFADLSPLNLLFSCVLLLLFQQNWSGKISLAFVCIALVGFFAELLGTQTSLLFGSYQYGPVLGWKIWDTPLLIGINWLVLSVGIYVLLQPFKLGWLLPFLGALLMVIFDWVMEPVAVQLNMWQWDGGLIPWRNYTDWFLLSFVIFLFMKMLRLNLRNPLAVWVVGCQFIFFLALNISLKFI